MYLTSEQNTRSVRTAPYPDGQRLLIVTGEIHEPGAPGVLERRDELAEWARARFGVLDIAYSWSAQDNSTTDRIPFGRFHPGTEHVYVATGFGGWRMSNGVLSGQLLAGLIAGEAPPWAGIYDPRRLHPVVEAGSFVKSNVAVARHFVIDRLRASATTPEALSPGEGAVMWVNGEQLAVHRDDFGRPHAVSATCSHLAAWWVSTTPNAPGTAPVTAPGSSRTAPCCTVRPPSRCRCANSTETVSLPADAP